jgi:hypothetical protein
MGGKGRYDPNLKLKSPTSAPTIEVEALVGGCGI